MPRRCGCWRCTSRWPRSRVPTRPALRGTTQNDILKEYLSRGTYAFPPEPSLRLTTDVVVHTFRHLPEVEPAQHLQLPPPGGGGDAGPGTRLRPGQRDRGPRWGARLGPGPSRRLPRRRRAHQLLRQRRHPVRRGGRQDARLRRTVGPHHPRPLRRHRPACSSVPLRRAGQQSRPDRAAAREQHRAHPHRDAWRHVVARCPCPRRAVARLERGAGPAATVGPAVVAADAAGARTGDRPARVPRPVRRVDGHGGEGRRTGRAGRRRTGSHPGDGRGGGRGRLDEGRTGRPPMLRACAASRPASRWSSA